MRTTGPAPCLVLRPVGGAHCAVNGRIFSAILRIGDPTFPRPTQTHPPPARFAGIGVELVVPSVNRVQGPFELEDAIYQPEWEYDQLCRHLGNAEEMADRLALLSVRQEARASATAPVLPPRTTAAAVAATAVEG